MNKSLIKLLSFCLFCLICFAACERYPVRALLGLPDPIDSWPDPWFLYDDQINTKGSLSPFKWESYTGCADWDKVKLDFACKDRPKSGRNCMQLTWVGNINDPDSTYFGFGLMAREYPRGVVNLASSGYQSLKFWVRGHLYNNCSLEIKIPKDEGTSWTVPKVLSENDITSEWQEIIIHLPYIEEIEYDISISLVSSGETNGGTVYLDDIRFTKDL